MQDRTVQNVRALSIAGPFARLIAEGSKEIELRSWKTNFRGLVLLHSSTSRDFDACFDDLEMSLDECPKSAIIGAAILTDCIAYTTARQWNDDLERHLWIGDEPYATIRQDYYNGNPPIGHVFEHPILFDPFILDIPGAFNYWQPRNPRQQAGFDKALAIIEELIAEAC